MADEADTGRTQAQIDALLAQSRGFTVGTMSMQKHTVQDRIALEKHESRKRGHAFGFRAAVMRGPEH